MKAEIALKEFSLPLQDALPVPLSDTQWSSVTINVTDDSCPQFNLFFFFFKCLCGVKIVC